MTSMESQDTRRDEVGWREEVRVVTSVEKLLLVFQQQ